MFSNSTGPGARSIMGELRLALLGLSFMGASFLSATLLLSLFGVVSLGEERLLVASLILPVAVSYAVYSLSLIRRELRPDCPARSLRRISGDMNRYLPSSRNRWSRADVNHSN